MPSRDFPRTVLLLSLILATACGGGGSSPTAPTATPTGQQTSTPTATTLTLTGTVTNIITGATISGGVIEVGGETATSGADGAYSLTITASSTQSFSASASGYYTRQSSVSMTGTSVVNLQLIPNGDGFNLALFDHLFREKGQKGTQRWTSQPTFEIWTQEFTCLETNSNGEACIKYQAKGTAPTIFETNVRNSIAKMGQLTGSALSGSPITTKTHSVGTTLTHNDWGTTVGTISFAYVTGLYGENNAGASGDPNNKIHIDYGANVYTDQTIHLHEVAHAVGFRHPDGSNNMPQPGIMGPWPYQWTSADERLGRILYLRPTGSLTPDIDPTGTIIN